MPSIVKFQTHLDSACRLHERICAGLPLLRRSERAPDTAHQRGKACPAVGVFFLNVECDMLALAVGGNSHPIGVHSSGPFGANDAQGRAAVLP